MHRFRLKFQNATSFAFCWSISLFHARLLTTHCFDFITLPTLLNNFQQSNFKCTKLYELNGLVCVVWCANKAGWMTGWERGRGRYVKRRKYVKKLNVFDVKSIMLVQPTKNATPKNRTPFSACVSGGYHRIVITSLLSGWTAVTCFVLFLSFYVFISCHWYLMQALSIQTLSINTNRQLNWVTRIS